jgi:chromosome segregation ATPase
MCLFLQLQVELDILRSKSGRISQQIQKENETRSNLKKQLEESKTELERSKAVKENLTNQIDGIDEMLRSEKKEMKQMNITIEGLRKTLDLLNRTVEELCGQPNDVSACKVTFVTVHSLN